MLTVTSPYAIISMYSAKGVHLSMAFKITDACISCGACVDTCPVSAISEGDDKYVIDADVCIDCGACADSCPTEAIEE